MILSIDGQLVNAYIEPQFFDLTGGPIVSVEFYGWENVPNLRKHIKGDLRVARVARYFNFVGYMQLLDLCYLAGNYKISKEDLLTDQNISPAPVAYSWSAWEADIELEDGEYESGEYYFGYSLPEDLEYIPTDSDVHYECFYAYPLFTMPTELEQTVEEKQR
jgi:hypothetical protein